MGFNSMSDIHVFQRLGLAVRVVVCPLNAVSGGTHSHVPRL